MRKVIFYTIFSIVAVGLQAQNVSTLQQRKLMNAIQYVSALYVDSVKESKLVETAIEGMLKELDPHSYYIPKEELERMREPLEGSFEGVGIQFQLMEDTLLVVQTIAGCPAEKVGVLPGDQIIYIGKELIAGVKMENSDIMKRLRGPKGTEVTVKIKRGTQKELIDFKIIRDKIPVYTVGASYMIGKEIGYIKINNFGSTTMDEYQKAFKKLEKQGMKHLILSLQGNGGGYLNVANDLADEFLTSNKMVVYTEGLNQPKMVLRASPSGGFEKGKLIVLVDEYSASASEIVSGAVQDWDRGVIMGRRTFGKGLVQREIPLIDGSMMRLTTARYYTPSGRCIQKPYKNGLENYENDIEERYKKGEMQHADSIHFADSLQYKTLVLKRKVYGGGGIMPDIFVPLDTVRFTTYHRDVVGHGVLNKLALQYVNANRDLLKKQYPAFDLYNSSYVVSEAMLEQMKQMAEKEGVKMNEAQYTKSKAAIQLQLKAMIARDLWDMNEYYQIMDEQDEILVKAIELINTPGAYEKVLH